MAFNADGTWTPDSPLGIRIGQPLQTSYGTQFQTGVNTDANASQVTGAVSTATPTVPTTGGLAEQSWGDKFSSWFTPQGDKGTSLGGNVVNAVGTGVGALSGLAGMYYTKKNYDLQKDNQKHLQAREAKSDARKEQLAANAGNGASY